MSLWDNFKKVLINNDCNDEFIRIKSLAEQGDANAQNELGTMYAHGKGVAKNYFEAWKWYSLALKQKHPSAAGNRANLVMTRAQGVEVDKNMKVWIQNTFEKNIPALEKRIKELTGQHIEALSLKHEKTVYKDDYGNVFYEKWDKEIDYFIEKMILTDREIDDLLWDSRNQKFYEICITIINNVIGGVTARTGT
jgi:TPR repeat protein